MLISCHSVRDGQPEPPSCRSDIRAQLDFENNLRAEIWSVHIGARLGVDPIHVEAVVAEALTAFKGAGALISGARARPITRTCV